MAFLEASGSYEKTQKFLNSLLSGDVWAGLDRYGQEGVNALGRATPKLTGLASESWDYTVTHSPNRHTLSWNNTDVEGGVNIAVILQYGHGTGTGGYVAGIDYINPTMGPLFDKIIKDIWEELING
jgi:hypothetical protein